MLFNFSLQTSDVKTKVLMEKVQTGNVNSFRHSAQFLYCIHTNFDFSQIHVLHLSFDTHQIHF